MLTSGAIARINKDGSEVQLSCPVLKMESLSDPAPNKKTRMGYLSDGNDTIKAVFASQPSTLIFDGKVVAGTVIKLVDYSATLVKEKWALMVTRLEVVEATEADVKAEAEEEQATEEAAAAPADDIKEDAKMEEEEKEVKEEATEDAKMDEAKTEEEAQDTAEDEPEGRPAKVRIMEEKDGNRPVASPAPAAAKPAAEASPTSAASKPAATPQSAPKTGTKENVTPKSGRSVPASTPGSISSRRVVPIAALNPYNETWTIKAKVVGKSPIRTFNMRGGGEGKVASMDLVDEEGTVIGATMWREFVDRHYDSLEDGKVYFFTRGSVKPANKKYASTRNDYELSLDGRTSMEECTDVDSSKMVAKLDIVPIDQLASLIAQKAPVDIMAIVVNCGEEGTVKRKSDDSELRRLNITLVDQSLKTVECTLWNSLCDTAASFRDLDHPVVAINSVRISEFQGVSLSTVSRSVVRVNPDTEEATKLREWYDTEGRGAATQAAGEGLMTTTPGGGQSRNARETLKDIQPEDVPAPEEKPTYHNVIATFAFMSTNQTFYYMAHPETNRKVVEQNGAYFCEYDGKTSQTMRRRYVLQAKLMDFKADGWVSVFNDQAEMLLGCTADELAVDKEAGTEEGSARLEETIKGSMWSDWKMRVMTKSREYQGESKLRITVQDISPVNYEDESKLLLQRIAALKA